METYWSLEDGTRPDRPPERVVPDGCMELVFNFADPVFHHVEGGRAPQPRAMLVGAMRHAMVIQASGRMELFGIRLRPGGLFALTGRPPGPFVDASWDVDGFADLPLTQLGERLGNAPGHVARVALADQILRALAGRSRGAQRLPKLLRYLRASSPLPTIDTLARAVGCSPRQLERYFLAEVGVGPKALARVERFVRVARHLERAPAPGSQLALRYGYADQSHLIREFTAFAGVSPTRYVRERHPMAERFLLEDVGFLQDRNGLPR